MVQGQEMKEVQDSERAHGTGKFVAAGFGINSLPHFNMKAV